MSYRIDLLREHRALLLTWNEDFRYVLEGETMGEELTGLMDRLDHPVYFINDVRTAQLSFDDLLTATNAAVSGKNPVLKHPKVLGTIIVTHSEIIRLAAKGMNSVVFNNTKVATVDSVEKALMLIRERTGAR